uniref:1,2-dihydroxyethylphosphonate kinase n=1 Tax=Streptomyces luridus TaxID=67320 RepID=D7PC14_STRLR|nr:1,2-dihydroxyethylphosphonate kinase [Streptomyces luridus]
MNRGPAPAAEIVVAPNCMRGYASAAEVAAALITGVRRVRPRVRAVARPLADGGDGTLDALYAACGGVRHPVAAVDVLGRTRKAHWLALDRRTAAVETAGVCGLGALRPRELRPLRATSAGAGQAVAAAVEAGATTVLVGLGGTAVVDGGAGALAALGARFLDRDGHEVEPVPERLPDAVRVDLSAARRLLEGVTVRLLADVRTPLSGNLDSFGAQKGVTAENRPAAVRALQHLTSLLGQAGDLTAADRFRTPWFGAGGGIGFGLSAVAATTAESGTEALLDITDPGGSISTAALVITAEGAIDPGTWQGKLPGTIARLRRDRGLPTAMVAARAEADAATADPLVTVHLAADPPLDAPLVGPALHEGLARAAAAACRTWAVAAA